MQYNKATLKQYILFLERKLQEANEEIRHLSKELGREAPHHNPNQLEFDFNERNDG